MTHGPALLHDPVRPLLLRLTAPMLFGSLGSLIFATSSMYFIARLGPEALAALSFTLPVAFMTAGLVSGLAVGTGTMLAQAIGADPQARHGPRATACLVLGLLLVVPLVACGWVSIGPAFRLLGATPELIARIGDYMRVWWLAMLFELPLAVAAALIQAQGNTRFPAAMIGVKALVNILVCPALVFGVGGWRGLGIAGAAWAVLLAELATLAPTLWMLRRSNLLSSLRGQSALVFEAWRAALRIALPATLTHCMVPFSYGAVTRLAASFGPSMVAAMGTAVRIESCALLPTAALSLALTPFIGQNWGGGRMARVREGERAGNHFALLWGLGVWVVMALAARPLAHLFTRDPEILEPLISFLRIVPAGYGLQGVMRLLGTMLNAIGRPHHATGLNLLRLFGMYVPLTYAGAAWFGMHGMWAGVALSNILGGFLFLGWMLWIGRGGNLGLRGHEVGLAGNL